MSTEMIVQIITLSLIILVPLMLWGSKPTKWATIGCVMYALSYFIANIWHIAFWTLEPPHAYGFALRLYQAGTLLLVAIYTGVVFLALRQPRITRETGATTINIMPETGKKLVEHPPIIVEGFDMQARLVWLVLFIAEGFAVVEYAQCKMLYDPFGSGDLLLSQVWGIEVSRYACGRALGTLSPYAAPIITSAYLVWVNLRKRRV